MSAPQQPQPNSPNQDNSKHEHSNLANSSAGASQMMQRLTGRKSWIRGLAILGLVGIYAAARPAINERTGLNLPALKVDSRGQVVSANADQPNSSTNSKSSTPSATAAAPEASNPDNATALGSPGPLARRVPTEPTDNAKSTSGSAKSTSNKTAAPNSDKADPSLRYGLLRDTGGERYISPAGLLYTPGSAEGHRIEHVRRHTEDDPGRPGSHGVFDGGIEGALQTIDDAYERAKKGNRTTKQVEDDRVVYTVDMGKRVGFVGGRDGGRRNKPMARRVTLVLEGNRVITAYPK